MTRLIDGHDSRELERSLQGLSFPALKHDVVHAARKNGAANEVVAVLEQLPVTQFSSLDQVIQVYGEAL